MDYATEDKTLTPVSPSNIDILALHRQFFQIQQAASDPADRNMKLAQLLVGLTNAAGCVFFAATADGIPYKKLEIGARILSRQALAWNENLLQILHQQAETACEQDTLQTETLDGNNGAQIMTAPLAGDDQCRGAISLVLALGDQEFETFVTVLQLFASVVVSFDYSSSVATADPDCIIKNIEKYYRLDDVAHYIVDTLTTEFHCHKLALSVPSLLKKCRVVAVSHTYSIDKRNDLIHDIQLSMARAIDEGKVIHWISSNAQYAELSAVAKRFDLKDLLLLPLFSYEGQPAGCILMGWQYPGVLSGSMLQLISKKGASIGGSLYSMMHGFYTSLGYLLHQLRAPDNTNERRLVILLPILLIIIMLLPINYKISGESVVQPMQHRFVVSQFDGILDEVRVNPGDVVSTGQIMAVMDGRELNRRLYGLQADRDRATKKADVQTAEGNTASAQIARLDVQRINTQIELIKYQLDHLEIRSAINGQVLLGDLEQQEGRPVERGQKLFEVGSLDKMLIEIAIPADEIRHYINDMPVEVRLEALPDLEINQVVKRLHPRATVQDGNNVFIAEIEIDNDNNLLRPGMRGHSRLNVGKHRLIWVWLHKPYEKLMSYLPW